MALQPAVGRRAVWKDFSAVDAAGGPVTMRLKAWLYDRPEAKAAWELRRLMAVFFARLKSFKVDKMLVKMQAEVGPIMQCLGLDWSLHVFPSERAESYRVARGLPASPATVASYIRGEFSITTEALVVWLLHETIGRRVRHYKDLAKTMLTAFLTSLALPTRLAGLEWGMVWCDQVLACCPDGFGDGTCAHVATQPVPPRDGKDGVPDLIATMTLFMQRATFCGAAAEALGRLVDFIADAALSVDDSEVSTDPYKQTALRGAKRMRRVDEDYRALVMLEMPRKRAIIGGQVAIACDKDMRDESRGRDWMKQQINEYLHSGWYQMQQHGKLRGPVSLAEDAARIGNPKQETEVMVMWCPELATGRFLPVQVVCGVEHSTVSIQRRNTHPFSKVGVGKRMRHRQYVCAILENSHAELSSKLGVEAMNYCK